MKQRWSPGGASFSFNAGTHLLHVTTASQQAVCSLDVAMHSQLVNNGTRNVAVQLTLTVCMRSTGKVHLTKKKAMKLRKKQAAGNDLWKQTGPMAFHSRKSRRKGSH